MALAADCTEHGGYFMPGAMGTPGEGSGVDPNDSG